MIVVDASVLIAHLEAGDQHHERARALLVGVDGDMLAASPVTLAEVLVGPARSGSLGRAQTQIADLEVVVVALPDDAPARLATLRAQTGLKLPDCCVVLAAAQVRGAVATFDNRLARVAADHGLEVRYG